MVTSHHPDRIPTGAVRVATITTVDKNDPLVGPV